jgi:UDP-N-acetylglucosamine 2-epimerase (non-hydrolysing)
MHNTHITHVVGARPNFMKAAPVHEALARSRATQRVIHTGQHYDERLSDIFFRQLELPEPDVNLGVGSGSHSAQTARVLLGLEQTIHADSTSAVVVYGDVNSTLASALLCAKERIPLVHVEAGLRSFDRSMPEEINRILTDVVADLLLITSPEAYAHLAAEGISASRIRFVGNPMIDTLLRHRHRFDPAPVVASLGLPSEYGVVTLHRPANVDDPTVARSIIKGLHAIAATLPLVVPLHPRGREHLGSLGLEDAVGLHVIEPLGYVEFLSLISGAKLAITDSGGVQEETTILEVPCLTVRPNTERPITITHGTNRLCTPDSLAAAAQAALLGEYTYPEDRPPLWDGRAGQRIAAAILDLVEERASAARVGRRTAGHDGSAHA